MDNKNDLKARLVPAICTQCGAALEVDPTQDAAVCKYCNTPFIVDKAIQSYNIQNAKIEHVDKVTIDMKGTADSFFGFLGQQMSESREVRREARKEEREQRREVDKAFIKMFTYMMVGMFILAAIAFVIMQIRGFPDDAPASDEQQTITETVQDSGTDNSTDNGTGASFNFEFHTGG